MKIIKKKGNKKENDVCGKILQIQNQMEKQNEKLQKQVDNFQEQFQKQKEKGEIIQFINDVNFLINDENFFNMDMKIFCLEEKNKLKEYEVSKLIALVKNLYCLENIAIYRKIAYCLRIKLIEIFSTNFESKFDGTVTIKASCKNKSLKSMFYFLLFVNTETSELLHFSGINTELLSKDETLSNKIEEIAKIRDSKEFIDFVKGDNFTYLKLIETFKNNSYPLLFFKMKDEYNKDDIEKTINTLIKKLNNNLNIKSFENLELKINELNDKKESIIKNNIPANIEESVVKEFKDKCCFIEKEMNKIKNLKEEISFKEGIIMKLNKVLELKKNIKTHYFSFQDLVEKYRNNDLRNAGFNPYDTCKSLLFKYLNDKVIFLGPDNAKLEF